MIPVGVTTRTVGPTRHGEHRMALDRRWPVFLAACDIAPVPLPSHPGLAVELADALNLCGLVLSGGDDLASCGGLHRAGPGRKRALRWAEADEVPVLGVCRGMQLIVEHEGGRLLEVDGHVGTDHEVHSTTGATRTVNSFLRWGAVEVRESLDVVASCGDLIEAVRHRSRPTFGIMWHPERVEVPDPDDVLLMQSIFGARS